LSAAEPGDAAFLPAPLSPGFAVAQAIEAPVALPRFGANLASLVSLQADSRPLIPRGANGSGGRVAICTGGRVIDATGLDRLIAFNPSTQRVRAQAGLRLVDALAFLAPLGHSLAVTPAWGATTLAGATATDGHGANHDAAGAFGAWVRALRLHRTDRPAMTLAPGDPSGLFEATIGGLGLTGMIEWVEMETIPIRSSMMRWEAEPFSSLAALERLFSAAQDWTHKRAWLDPFRPGFGRFERFAIAAEGPCEARYPQPLFTAPGPVSRGLANRVSVGLVTRVLQQRGPAQRLRDYASAVFPFDDAMERFDRLFGKRGCAQHQSVTPPAAAFAALGDMLAAVKAHSDGLALIGATAFGARPPAGVMSFPREGLCVSVRMRASKDRPARLFARLDEIVRAAGGRLNPAADGRAPADLIADGAAIARWRGLCDPAFKSDALTHLGAA
jgi:L-gulonolactone oxidase